MNETFNKSIQIYGPFSTAYSLSEVNRELGIALSKIGFNVSFVDDKRLIDRYPSTDDFKQYPEIKEMMKPRVHSDIAIWNRYPYDHLELLDADFKILSIAWEPSILPKPLVKQFNNSFNLIFAKSTFTKQALIRSGIKIPILILPDALNPLKMESAKGSSYKIDTQKGFRFLNISSGIPRKGLDVLIQAYFNEFTNIDDVTLIIKTNSNDFVDIELEKLKSVHGVSAPEVIRIRGDISEDCLLSLYYHSHAYVTPTRCEGFNLPALQAAFAKLPIIATGYSGHLDFLNPDNSYLIDYTLTDASAAFGIHGALWAGPSILSLQAQMRQVYEHPNTDKVTNAYETSLKYTWDQSANLFKQSLKEFEDTYELKNKNIGVFSTWNTKCGIAQYSKHFYSPISSYFKSIHFFATKAGIKTDLDESYVYRIWDELQVIDLDVVEKELMDKKIDIFHIQYNSGFYNLEQLTLLTSLASTICEKVFVTFHSLNEIENVNGNKKYMKLIESLNISCTNLFVHRDQDAQTLKNFHSINTIVIPHGNSIHLDEDRNSLRSNFGITSSHIISSHGFILPDKAFIETIRAVGLLKAKFPDILFIMATAVHSTNASSNLYLKECEDEIKKLKLEDNILIIKDFLTIDEIMVVLHLSDCIVNLRKNTSLEGASGAIRFPLTSNRPVIINKAKIFQDIENLTLSIGEINPRLIASKITEIFENPSIYEDLKPIIKTKLNTISWDKVSQQYLKIICK